MLALSTVECCHCRECEPEAPEPLDYILGRIANYRNMTSELIRRVGVSPGRGNEPSAKTGVRASHELVFP